MQTEPDFRAPPPERCKYASCFRPICVIPAVLRGFDSGVGWKLEGFDTAKRAAVLVEYAKGLLLSLTIDGAAPGLHELSMIDGAGGHVEIDMEAARDAMERRNVDPGLGDATRLHLAHFFNSIRNDTRP